MYTYIFTSINQKILTVSKQVLKLNMYVNIYFYII